MNGALRREVLRTFKKLHRTRLNTFKGDDHALNAVRKKINDEFAKNKYVTDESVIEELNKFANEVECEVRTTVVQAVEVKPGRVALQITPDTVKIDNVPSEFFQTQCKKIKNN